MRLRCSRPAVAGLMLMACSGPGSRVDLPATQLSGRATAAQVAGTWALRSPDGRFPGMRLELVFDSAAGSTFRARVAFLMQGDVGIDPSLFQPGRGDVVGDTLVRVELRATSPAVPPSRIAGRLAGDTILVREFVWAGEDRTTSGRKWILVRLTAR